MVVVLVDGVLKVVALKGNTLSLNMQCELPESHRATRGLLVMIRLMVCISNKIIGIEFLSCFDFGVGMLETMASISF